LAQQGSGKANAGQITGKSSTRPSGLASREPQLRSARAARERAAASLADAQLSLSRTRITPPFGGLVSAENASIGTFVQTGQSLGTIVGTNAYDVRLSMTQDEAALVPGLLQGKGKNIRADIFYDYGGQRYRWTAYIDRADASLDSTTRNVEVFVRVPNPLKGGRLVQGDGQESPKSPAASPAPSNDAPPLLIGAFVEAQIAGAPQGRYAAIASSALRPGNEIWLVRDGKLQIVPVRVIRRGEKLAYIASDAFEGDALKGGGRLVTSSLTAPTNNMPVRLSGKAAK
jgi:multidrug efflux pump subunit AcrA (membrane-fusion protein)